MKRRVFAAAVIPYAVLEHARSLGVTFSNELLLRADKVIE